MIIFIVDDERYVLADTRQVVENVINDAEIHTYTKSKEALEEVSKWKPDVAFLDIEMPGMKGIELAKHMKDASPLTNIIFLTGYDQYGIEAVNMHASGYILKPAEEENIEQALHNLRIKHPVSEQKRVKVQTFGNFDLLVDNKPVIFERAKSKEAFAYIVSRMGSTVTKPELAAVLWEDKDYDRNVQQETQRTIKSLQNTLEKNKIGEILRRERNALSVDIEAFDCDYYRFQKGDMEAVNSYMGEFMVQYSWAEMIAGYLDMRI